MHGKEEINQAKAEANEAIQKLADIAVSQSDMNGYGISVCKDWSDAVNSHKDKNLALQAENNKLKDEVEWLKGSRFEAVTACNNLHKKNDELGVLCYKLEQKLSFALAAR